MNSKLVRLGLVACALFAFAGMSVAQTSTTTKPAASKSKMVDINSASVDELSALPGMTADISQKVVDGRPYKMKSELVSKNVLPKATYDKIAKMVVAKPVDAGATAKPAAAPVGW